MNLVVILILACNMKGLSQTYVSGENSGKWTAVHSPYVVTADVTIPANDTLIIEAGVEVRFNSGTAIRVYSASQYFFVKGTQETQVHFTSNESNPHAGDWNGIVLSGTWSRASMKNCIVEYAKNGIECTAWASGCDDADNYSLIDSCIFRYNSLNGIYCRGSGSSYSGCTFPKTGSSSPTISHCQIYENQGSGIGLVAYDGFMSNGNINATIDHNVIRNNGQDGIVCYGDDNVQPEIRYNNIVGNIGSGIKFNGNFSQQYFIIENNILLSNGTGIHSTLDSIPTYNYNDVWNNTEDYIGLDAAENDLSADPLFTDMANHDYHLTALSPCIDAGDPDITDPDGTVSDIGAFFYAQPPVAGFTAGETEGIVPFTVAFTDASTGDVEEWTWDFGDGTGSDLQNPEHTYASIGFYSVTLIIKGAGGSDTHTKQDFIHAKAPPPVAGFTADGTEGDQPLTVTFTDTSEGDIEEWLWDFGDGSTSDLQNPSHTYTSSGTFTVSLTVTGEGGEDTQTQADYIMVNRIVSLDDVSQDDRLIVTPNPAGPFCLLSYTLEKPEHITVTLMNSQGQIVRELYTNPLHADSNEMIMDVSGLPPGLYLIAVLSETTHTMVEILILK